MEEKQSIKDSAKCLRKYGSVANYNYTKHLSNYFRHMITANDTLQGIALKYGVTTEEIRRINKLWANDSLFLRESLLIPSVNGIVPSTSSSVCLLNTSSEPDLFVNQSSEGVQNDFSRSSSLRSSSSSYRNDDDLDSYNDFLNRIDADIANKRQQLKISQNKSLFCSESNNASGRRKPVLSRLKQQQRLQQHPENHENVPIVITQGKRVRSSLQKLQEKQEQIFEL